MCHLMRQQAGGEPARIVVNHGALGHAIIAGLMVFQPKMRCVITQGQQEMIFTIMPRSV